MGHSARRGSSREDRSRDRRATVAATGRIGGRVADQWAASRPAVSRSHVLRHDLQRGSACGAAVGSGTQEPQRRVSNPSERVSSRPSPLTPLPAGAQTDPPSQLRVGNVGERDRKTGSWGSATTPARISIARRTVWSASPGIAPRHDEERDQRLADLRATCRLCGASPRACSQNALADRVSSRVLQPGPAVACPDSGLTSWSRWG
jgi:hypothetical protein